MPTPYHVRLAVSQYGEQFRAELFTEDLGDTEGDLLTELPPSIAEWLPYLAQGADLPPDAARQLGKDLFAALLGQPENAKKWAEVLAQASRKGQPVRLLIDATTEAVRDLPYGLLCEPHDDWFLFRGGEKLSVGFVRILRRCSPRPLKLNARPRVLVAVAEPTSADIPAFAAPARLQKLAAAIHKDVELIICGPHGPKPLAEITPNPETAESASFAPYTHTTRDVLRKALAGEFDVLHLLAHGHGAGVLLCGPDTSPAETTAGELAEWCGAGRTALAFLQVCKAAHTAGRGGFGGVAQQLLNPRGGNLAAVVASTFPLDAEHSTDAAVAFYRQLAAGKPPEEALTADRAETDWCWAFLELWARPGALGGTQQQRAAFQFVSPYRGLSSFGEQDADLFFGRKAEVVELLQILRAEPVVAVVGDSGSGKTSLLQAGLIHAVRREGLAGSDRWKIVTLRPGYRPAQALLIALGSPATEPTAAALKAALGVESQPLMLVFDQFEELFTLARDKAEVQLLTQALADAVYEKRDRFRLIIGMRSEFLGQAATVPGLSRLIRRPWVLRPPSADDMRDIVAGPAEHCGYTFQNPLGDGNPLHATSLLDRILADPLLARDKAGASAAPLPLLQFALERLWLKAVEKGVTEFTHTELDEIGGMGKAIAQHAEAVYQAAPTATELGTQARRIAEQIITALVSTQGTRQPRVRESLQAETDNPDAARAVVDYLVGERLLVVRSDPEDMTKSLVDLSHEALIHNWDRLRGWLAEDPQGRAMRDSFRTAAEKWEAGFAGVQARSWYGLPGSDVARNYLAWMSASQPHLSPVQQEFAQAMRDMLARLRRRRRTVMGALGVLTFAAFALAFFAYVQAGKARSSADAANKSAEEAKENAKNKTKVVEYLKRVFQPTETIEGGNLTLGQALTGADKRIESEFADQPELREELLAVIREMKRGVGRRTPQAMILEVHGTVQLQSAAGTPREAVPQALVNLDDHFTLAADAQLELVFLSDFHKEWIKPGREAKIDWNNCEPPDAVLKRDNSILMSFVPLPKGTFYMGWDGQKFGVKTHIEQAFEIASHDVTQGQWQAVMGNNPSTFSRLGASRGSVLDISDGELKLYPVESVSWNQVQEFINKLNEIERASGYVYRLPTEEEWEYACRAGATSLADCSYNFYFDKPTNDLTAKDANIYTGITYVNGLMLPVDLPAPYVGHPTRVGTYKPNQLGLYDMHGNVWQWCSGDFAGQARRPARGGSWNPGYGFSGCHAAFRAEFDSNTTASSRGFRLVRVRATDAVEPKSPRNPSAVEVAIHHVGLLPVGWDKSNPPKFISATILVLSVSGPGVDEAKAVRTIVKTATDDTGKPLRRHVGVMFGVEDDVFGLLRKLPVSGIPPVGKPQPQAFEQQVRYYVPETVRSLTLTGTIELLVPEKDPGSTISVSIARDADTPLKNDVLKAAGVELTFKKPDGSNVLSYQIADPKNRFGIVEFFDASGTKLETELVTRVPDSSGKQTTFVVETIFKSRPPADAVARIYLITDKTVVAVPFELKDIPYRR
jgi:formylglycine-generating enzyme required for sulfatase activity